MPHPRKIEDKQLLALHRAGKTAVEIGAMYGMSQSAVSWRLRRLGEPPNGVSTRVLLEIGSTHGSWKILERAPNGARGQTLYKCRCKCGAVSVKSPTVLRRSAQCQSCARSGKRLKRSARERVALAALAAGVPRRTVALALSLHSTDPIFRRKSTP